MPAIGAFVLARRRDGSDERFDLEVAGGVFVDEPCVIDDNLVSGRTYHDHGRYVGPWIALLEAAAAQS